MKILHVINSLTMGGAEKLLLDSIPKYMAKGISSELLLLDGSDHPFLNKLRQTPNLVIRSLGKGSVYNPLYILKISRLLNQFDLIHVHLFPSLYWVAIAKIISYSKTPLLFTEHNTTNKRRNHLLLKRFDRIIYRKYKNIITISQEVDSILKEYLNVEASRFVLIPNGVDVEKIRASRSENREKFVTSKDEKIIIQVSNFNKQKDQKTLIKALAHVVSPVKLLLIGTGELIDDCKELVRRLKLENKVSFLGIRMDVHALLKMADLIVLSTNYEGLSLSSIEALASGKPFIASNAPGLSDVVQEAGVLFPIGDYLYLANEINRLLEDKNHYNKTASLCVERAQAFSLKKMIERQINLYTKVCRREN